MKRAIAAGFAALWLWAAPAWAETGGWFGGAVDIPDRHGDAMVAAGAVTVAGRVEGDALIAAGQARVNGDVAGDARVLAGEYYQSGNVSGELAVATGKFDLDGAVGDDLYVASEQVHIGSDARIGRNARITGHDVLIKGRIDGDLDVRGETVAISAQVGGNVTVRAKHIVLGPQTTIEGAFNWKAAEEPDIATDAIISHGSAGNTVKRWDRDGWGAWDRPWSAAPREAIFAGEAALRLMIGVSALMIAGALALLAPQAADAASAALRTRWAAALGWGALIAALAPAAAILLALTIVAIPLGLLMLLACPLLGLAGYGLGAAALGRMAVGETIAPRTRVLAAAGGVLAFTAIGFLPWVGLLAGMLATLIGLGVWIVLLRAPARA